MQPEESLHPEWDEMYAAGLPIAQIASVTGAREGTIDRHLERRRAVDPKLAAERGKAPRRPGMTWSRHLFELRDFIATYGRFPAIHGQEPGEQTLYHWLAAQRHAFLAQTLTWEQARQMGVLGDWVTTDREKARGIQWRQRLDEVVLFVAEHDRLPRHRPARAVDESSLGIWLQTQAIEAHHGRILPWRLEALTEAFPGWRRSNDSV